MLFPGYVFNLFVVNYLDVAVWRFKYYYYTLHLSRNWAFLKGIFDCWRLLEFNMLCPISLSTEVFWKITIYLLVVWPYHNLSKDFQSLQLTH